MDTIDILQKARDFLAQPGKWCPYTREDGVGRSCAMGGISRALGQAATIPLNGWDNEDCHPAVIALAAVIPSVAKARAVLHSATAQVCYYNNTTDQQTVVAWFDRAIENLREHPMEKV